jgi:aminomethyltransferase
VYKRQQLRDGPPRTRIGLRVDGRSIARDGATVTGGVITSGTYSPTLDAPIAQALVAREHAAPGTVLSVDLRGKPTPATVTALPLVPHRYAK